MRAYTQSCLRVYYTRRIHNIEESCEKLRAYIRTCTMYLKRPLQEVPSLPCFKQHS